ncbi:hypothetical protein MVES_000564 [Malassezia vespertilionis]|uniref:Protein kinase domain-containing protein n=1 Tax=Malassezia vespertilionis TaxID=2020962 RepID=A0A2N1JHG0_9BASI|nr:hypothetical protein MVES_000564 [Malassezia vespertilionis]
MQDKSNVPVTKLTRQQQREYRRDHSTLRESLHALSQELADGSRQINQYHILKPLGQGSFGAVYLGENRGDVNHFVAVKEFGKLRLRHNLRISSHRLTQFPEQRNATLRKENEEDPLFLVRTEIAIMKKLLHPNVIKLFEVLDDSDSEKLYMVFEYCPGGILIDVSPGKQVIPMTEDQARKSFVQILSGIDYLHNNGIVHRDIKPDNILFNEDRTVCKIVDFGVSEMFCMPGDDTMKRVAGSPAFMSPELCQAGHVEWHGCSDDIWSFGVTFFAMVMGRLPFDKKNVIELYESIQKDDIVLGEQLSPECCDLLLRMLDKREEHRITTDELYIHPWVTRNGLDHVPTLEEVNNSHVVREVTDEDVHSAISRISSVFTVARAVYKFKHHSMTRASSELMLCFTEYPFLDG